MRCITDLEYDRLLKEVSDWKFAHKMVCEDARREISELQREIDYLKAKLKYSGESKLEYSKDQDVLFDNMTNIIEEYLIKYGHPHMTIIADQTGVVIAEGVMTKAFAILDEVSDQ